MQLMFLVCPKCARLKGHLMPLHAEEAVESPEKNGNGKPVARNPLGYVDWDDATASNERVIMRSPLANRDRIIRDQYVRIEDSLGSRSGFLGRIVAGPFFSAREGASAHPDAGVAGDV